MVTHVYPALFAVDRNMNRAQDATGQFFEEHDLERAHPLPVQDLMGNDIGTTLTTSYYGITSYFRLPVLVAVWVSGEHEHVVWSIQGVIETVQDAVTAANAAADAAAQAASLVGAPTDVVIAGLLADAESATGAAARALLGVGGGGPGGVADPGVPFIRYRTEGGAGPWQAADRDIPERPIIWYGSGDPSPEAKGPYQDVHLGPAG